MLAEYSRHVGFAPEKHRGVFKMQVLKSGRIQMIDNHDKVTIVAGLALPQLQKVRNAIDDIRNDELEKPKSPGCMDAPSYAVSVRQTNGSVMTIWRRSGCRELEPKDEIAGSVAALIRSLEEALSQIDHLEN